MPVRWILFAAVAGGVFFAAISNELYAATSPPGLEWHVLLRKTYSVGAFIIVGAAFRYACGATTLGLAAVVAAYSLAIEIAQALLGSREGPWWNATDVLLGGFGGALAGRLFHRSPRPPGTA